MLKSRLQSVLKWAGSRIEIIVPVLGLLMLSSILKWSGGQLSIPLQVLVIILALGYAVLIILIPMQLPTKKPKPFTWVSIRRAALPVAAVVTGGIVVMAVISSTVGSINQNESSGLGTIAALLLAILLGTLGLASEDSLSIDLFPVFRRREIERIIYALCAAFFLALLLLLWDNLTSGISRAIAQSLGESPPDIRDTVSSFETDYPIARLFQFLIGAGMIEELLFRVGIMTLIWKLTGHWGWGLLISSICFGVYHISPLSGISALNTANQIGTVLSSFFIGLFMGTVYRLRGFTTAMLIHGLGDWMLVMLLANATVG